MTNAKAFIDQLKSGKIQRAKKQQEYYDTIEKVVVTYHDGNKKEFDPDNWYIFEERVRKVAKRVEVIKK